MKIRKKTSLYLCAGLALSSIPTFRTTANDWTDVALVGSLGAAAATGLYWFFGSESNEKLLEKSKESLHKVRDKNNYFVSGLEAMYHIDSAHETQRLKEQIIYNASEDSELYPLAEKYFGEKGRSTSYRLNTLYDGIKTLQSQEKKLEQRLNKIAQDDGTSSYIYQEMYSVYRRIQAFKTRLNFAYSYVKTHKSYFALYDFEDMCHLSRYVQEMDALRIYQHDNYALANQLHACVFARYSSNEHPGKIYQDYIAQIRSDRAHLRHLRTSLAYAYHTRIGWCKKLENWLYQVESIIVSDQRYTQSIREYEQYKLDAARLAAAQAQAAALQEQAYQMARQNKIRKEELREQRRRAREERRNRVDEVTIHIEIED